MIEFEIVCHRCGLINHDRPPIVTKATWLCCNDCGSYLIKFFDNPEHKEDYRFGDDLDDRKVTISSD